MGCFRTKIHVVVLVVLVMAIAAWTMLLPQYVFISLMATVLYHHMAVLALESLCKWSRRYSAMHAAGGVASILAYAYAMNKATSGSNCAVFHYVSAPREYAAWMSLQLIFILLTALATYAYLSVLKKLLPSKRQQPLLACCGFYTDVS